MQSTSGLSLPSYDKRLHITYYIEEFSHFINNYQIVK